MIKILNQRLKKRLKACFLSAILVTTSMISYNAIYLHNFIDIYKNDLESKAIWIQNISDKEKTIKLYKNYEYSDFQYKRDQAFFDEVFKEDIKEHYKDFDVTNSRFEHVDMSLSSYLKTYNVYQGNKNEVIKQKKLLMQRFEGDLSRSEYYKIHNKNMSKLYKDEYSFLMANIIYPINFESDYEFGNIQSFNNLFENEHLPQLILKDYSNRAYFISSKKDFQTYINFKNNKNTTFLQFLKKYQSGQLTEIEKYNFFKILNFINYTMNEKYKSTNNTILNKKNLEKNNFQSYSIGFLDEYTKYYSNISNDIANRHLIYNRNGEGNLTSPY